MSKTELTIKHLAPYLPYGLKMKTRTFSRKHIEVIILNGNTIDYCLAVQRKPILRLLSDLTEDIEHNGIMITPCEILFDDNSDFGGNTPCDTAHLFKDVSVDMCLNYEHWQKLFEWHFDVFGLIKAGLAIDLNTITNKHK